MNENDNIRTNEPCQGLFEINIFSGNIKNPRPAGVLTVNSALAEIQSDKYRAVIEKAKEIHASGDKDAYRNYKTTLPAYSFSGTFSPSRAIKNLQNHSGFIVLDIDVKPGENEHFLDDIESLKAFIINDVHTFSAFLSPSQGVKVLVPVSGVTDDRGHKLVFDDIEKYYLENFQVKIDPSGKNVDRLCFVSHDPDLFYNPNAEPFLIPDPIAAELPEDFSGGEEITYPARDGSRYAEKAIENAVNMVDRAADGRKHTELLKAANLLGGYVAGGMLLYSEAEQVLYDAIKRKPNVASLPDALKTIKKGIQHGQSRPILFDDLEQKRQEWIRQNRNKPAAPVSEKLTDEQVAEIFDILESDPHNILIPQNIRIVRQIKDERPADFSRVRVIVKNSDVTLKLFDNALETKKGGKDINPDNLPVIPVNEIQLRDMRNLAWKALLEQNDPPVVFLSNKGLSWVGVNKYGYPEIQEMGEDWMRDYLADMATWVENRCTKADGPFQFPAVVPMVVAKSIIGNRSNHSNLPVLKRIVCAPIFNRDGEIRTEPGYDINTQCFIKTDDLSLDSVPSVPTSQDMKKAVDIVYDLIFDFPFVSSSERANAIGFFLLPFVKEMIEGLTPLHLFEANTSRTGKTLLVEILSFPFLNQWIATKSEIKNDEELRKQITTKLVDGSSHVFFDNLNYGINSGILAQAATSEIWDDRLLGGNESFTGPVDCIWVLSGNNPKMSRENLGRTIRIRQDANMEFPEERKSEGFRHPKIKKWVKDHRGDIVWAALTICQNWIAKGQPEPSDLPAVGGFEEWRDIIGGILQSAGINGFLSNMSDFRADADDETTNLRSLIGIWWKNFQSSEVLAKDLFPLVIEEGLELDINAKSERGIKTKFGNLIKKLKDRHFTIDIENRSCEVTVVKAGKSNNSRKWQLVLPENICQGCGQRDFWKSKSLGEWFCMSCCPPDEEDVADWKVCN